MRNIRRLLIIAAATSIMVSAFAVPALAGAESTLLARINNSRANAGKAPVEVYWDLKDDARAHTNRMIDAGHIYHNPNLSGVTGVWQKLGENVGVGVDANSLHDAFMASSSHRANILGDFNYVGIGAKTSADGLLWVTVVFMKADPGLNGGGTTTTTTTAPPTTTTTTAPPANTPDPVPPADTPAPAPPTTTTTVPPSTPTTPSTTTPPHSSSSDGQAASSPGVRTAASATSSDEPGRAVMLYTSFGKPDYRPAIAR